MGVGGYRVSDIGYRLSGIGYRLEQLERLEQRLCRA